MKYDTVLNPIPRIPVKMADLQKYILFFCEVMSIDSAMVSPHSKEEDLTQDVMLMHMLKTLRRSEVPRVSNYLGDTVSEYNDFDFKHHYRIMKSTFQLLVDLTKDALTPLNPRGREAISVEAKLLVFLWYIVNKNTMREAACLFGMSESTVYHIIKEVTKVR